MENWTKELGRQMMYALSLDDLDMTYGDAAFIAQLNLKRGLEFDFTNDEIELLKVLTERYIGYGREN